MEKICITHDMCNNKICWESENPVSRSLYANISL